MDENLFENKRTIVTSSIKVIVSNMSDKNNQKNNSFEKYDTRSSEPSLNCCHPECLQVTMNLNNIVS